MWKRQIIGQFLRKGYYNIHLHAAATVVFALVWWGILYPDICFTEDTFQQIIVTDGEEETIDEVDYMDIMEATGDEIVISSKLWEWLERQRWFRHGG